MLTCTGPVFILNCCHDEINNPVVSRYAGNLECGVLQSDQGFYKEIFHFLQSIEDLVRKPLFADLVPEMLYWVQFRTVRGQEDEPWTPVEKCGGWRWKSAAPLVCPCRSFRTRLQEVPEYIRLNNGTAASRLVNKFIVRSEVYCPRTAGVSLGRALPLCAWVTSLDVKTGCDKLA